MKVAVVGTGLIGGAFASGLRQRGLARAVVGLDVDPRRAAQALAMGLIDAAAQQVPEDADAVLLAVPADAVAPWVRRLAEHAGVLMDVASVKGPVIAALRKGGGKLPPRFVPCHPIAGSEHSGPQAADGALFVGRSLILTPAPETDPAAVAEASELWRGLGASVHRMSAEQHDELVAAVSHLPHLLAFAYMQQIEERQLAHVGGGFEDFTRIAAANPALWSDILRLNRGPLRTALGAFRVALERLEGALADGQRDALQALIGAAQAKRRKISGG